MPKSKSAKKISAEYQKGFDHAIKLVVSHLASAVETWRLAHGVSPDVPLRLSIDNVKALTSDMKP